MFCDYALNIHYTDKPATLEICFKLTHYTFSIDLVCEAVFFRFVFEHNMGTVPMFAENSIIIKS